LVLCVEVRPFGRAGVELLLLWRLRFFTLNPAAMSMLSVLAELLVVLVLSQLATSADETDVWSYSLSIYREI